MRDSAFAYSDKKFPAGSAPPRPKRPAAPVFTETRILSVSGGLQRRYNRRLVRRSRNSQDLWIGVAMIRWQDPLQGGDEVAAATRTPCFQWSSPNQSRTTDGTALGCVVPRRSRALGYWPAAASNSAFGSRRRIHRSGARCGLRDR